MKNHDRLCWCEKQHSSCSVFHQPKTHLHCFSCNKGKWDLTEEEIIEMELDLNTQTNTIALVRPITEIQRGVVTALEDRGIEKKVAEKFRVEKLFDTLNQPYAYAFNHVDAEGTIIAQKIKKLNNMGYQWNGDHTKVGLFGEQVFPSGGKYITITEGECFPGDVEVLTNEGFKKFSELTKEEALAQWDCVTNEIEFQRPLAHIEKDYEGNLVRLAVKGYVHISPPEHNLIVFNKENGVYRKIPANTKNELHLSIPRCGVFNSLQRNAFSDNELRLLIAVNADGKVDYRLDGAQYTHFGFQKLRKVERLRTILENLDLDFTERYSESTDRTYMNLTLPEKYRNLDVKRYTESFILSLSSAQRELMLDELTYWDGNFVPNRLQSEFSSKHKTSCEAIQLLCHLSNRCSSVMHRKNEIGEWYKTSILHAKTTTSRQSVCINEEKYVGKVYCATMQKGSLIVRCEGKISITGNCDAMACYQILKQANPAFEPVVVSIPDGAGSAEKSCKQSWEYINSFENIILAFDGDEAGRKASEKIVKLFNYKPKVLMFSDAKKDKDGKWQNKDSNDYLLAGKQKEFVNLWWRSEKMTPKGVCTMKSLWDFMTKKEVNTIVPWPWEGMNKMLHGIITGHFVVIKAPPKAGKTSLLKEIAYHIHSTSKYNVGLIFLENTKKEIGLGLCALHMNKPIHPWDIPTDLEELAKAHEFMSQEDRITIFDPEDSRSVENIMDKIMYFIKAHGVRYILLDHITMLSYQSEDDNERRFLDKLCADLKGLTTAHDINRSEEHTSELQS